MMNAIYSTVSFVNNACGLFVFMWTRSGTGVATYNINTIGLDGVEGGDA